MSGTAPIELSASAIIQRIVGGEYQPQVIETIARGFLPLPQDDLIAVLAFLTNAADESVAMIARVSLSEIPSRIVHAMTTRPFLVGGSDRFDTALIEATEGRVIAKIGAEGVHSAMIVNEGIGIAIKVEDGAQRAQFPALLATLQQLGALPRELPQRLAEFSHRPLRTTRGEVVGEVRAMTA